MSNWSPLKFLLPLFLAILLGLGIYGVQAQRVHELVLAAGSPSGESYLLSRAIAQAVAKNHPNLQIKVISTCGSAQNLDLLESGKVALATSQADIPASSNARSIAVLYRDIFQLVVQPNSTIHHITDLTHQTIALQADSGEQRSFQEVTQYYGLDPVDLQTTPCQPPLSDRADGFETRQADGVFRVRTLGNDYIEKLVRQFHGQLIPIEQADALQIHNPAFETATIPQGAYQGNPAIPAQPLPTVAVKRLLLASKTLDKRWVRQITQTLDEHRLDIANALPPEHSQLRSLVTNISQPSNAIGTGIPMHVGARAYYDRNKPTLFSFILENGSTFVTLGTPAIAAMLWIWQRFLERWQQQQNLAEDYIREATQAMAEETEVDPKLRQKILRDKLLKLEQQFNQAATALVNEAISQESFRTFNEAYTTTRTVLDRRIAQASEELADRYIAQLVNLSQRSTLPTPPPSTQATSSNPVASSTTQTVHQQELAQILEEIETSLLNKELSQESFRTCLDAYRLAWEKI
ncbi:TAXI family TRAP transporter solute-binding subunit [Alkalinema sp. FACHB-956]|uniref:TAXI family TRAP transporter solute-binding subunit n=1 Tax=Alkalinema sp. FACHB-956 TaxID=2692768 RepID=UPI001682EC46|nr:TAXI family TRAP transporter solute-binding subunit [Alkalinema sp. FACHB-956]MBD2329856.1 TAXI family TRAP transporter solute-binding subunit [Alkalinema sp. FACHB-956]